MKRFQNLHLQITIFPSVCQAKPFGNCRKFCATPADCRYRRVPNYPPHPPKTLVIARPVRKLVVAIRIHCRHRRRGAMLRRGTDSHVASLLGMTAGWEISAIRRGRLRHIGPTISPAPAYLYVGAITDRPRNLETPPPSLLPREKGSGALSIRAPVILSKLPYCGTGMAVILWYIMGENRFCPQNPDSRKGARLWTLCN